MKRIGVTLEDKYTQTQGQAFLTGVQALVRLPIDQRRRDIAAGLNTGGFISGYRGSPLGGYDQQLHKARKVLDTHQIHVQPGLNEDLGATAVWGSQMVGAVPGDAATVQGVFGLWYGKAPGVDRTGDVFKHANFAGVSRHGGVVAVAGDDPNCKSSTLPSQSEFAFQDAEIPVLHPSSVQEVLDYGLYGFALSRFSGLWTGLIALADTMDAASVVRVDADRMVMRLPDGVPTLADGVHLRAGDAAMDKEARLRLYKIPAALAFVRANGLDRVVLAPPAGVKTRVGVMATGQAARDIFEALDAMGVTPQQAAAAGLAVYKVAMPWPLEPEGARAFAAGLETLFVVEHKRALIEPQLRDQLYNLPADQRPRIIGKTDVEGRPLLPTTGSVPIPVLARALYDLLPESARPASAAAYLERAEASREAAAATRRPEARAPHYCSGCPHNTSTMTLPGGSRALAGIGCHYMASWIAPRTDFFSQMGGEGVSWIGQAPFTAEEHVFVNLGDGTYSHSGSLAVRAAVAAGVNITYKILFNDAVAMTGGQTPDMAALTPQRIARQMLAEGVKRCVIVADDIARYASAPPPHGVGLFDRKDLGEVQEELRATPGVTVLIYDQMCATERRRKRKRGQLPAAPRRVFINPAVCEGCGDCSAKSNCLSVEPLETEFGRKRQINQSSCNQDYSCVEGFCPSFVSLYDAEPAPAAAPRETLPSETLPVPRPASPEHDGVWNILFAGVGGGGVTTVAAILGMAGHIEGRAASTLDMTGLAQKGGAVLSHLRFADRPEQIRSPRIPPAAADALIAGDLVVAATPEALGLAAPGRCRAVMNSDVAPTAQFVFNRDVRYDSHGMGRAVAKACASHAGVDAESLAQELLGDAIYANMIMAGFAFQKGLIPLSAEAIAEAITLNGVKAAENQRAFDLGRWVAHDRPAVERLRPSQAPVETPDVMPLSELIAHRMGHLTAYQDAAYAETYRQLVSEVRRAETRLDLGQDLTRAVATQYAKLMSYKDEYEVARLYTDGRFEDAVKTRFRAGKDAPEGAKPKLVFHLAPPLIAPKDPRTGHLRKIKLGAWMLPAFRVLAKFKGLRGTRFDPFGWTAERRMERALAADYADAVRRLVRGLDAATHDVAVRIASVPDQIRGFGHVKEASVAAAHAVERELWAEWEQTRSGEPSVTPSASAEARTPAFVQAAE